MAEWINNIIENNNKSEKNINTLIKQLEKDINESFVKWKEQIESLIQFASISNRNELKSKIQESSIVLKEWTDIDTLSNYMIELRNLREQTISLTNFLKEELNLEKIIEFITEIKSEDISTISKKLFPNLDYKSLSNPASLKEWLIAFAVRGIENIYSILKITFDVWKWILTSPYNLHQIASWKGEYQEIHNV